MSTGAIIAISIVVGSILLLLIVGIVSYRQTKPTMKSIKELSKVLQHQNDYYTREFQHLNEQATTIQERVELLQKEAEIKSKHFEDFMDEQGKFQTSVRYLKDHASEYTQGIYGNVKDELKEDGPKIKESFKRAFKKTIEKQKSRYQTNQRSGVIE